MLGTVAQAQVRYTGAMREVMKQGKLQGQVRMDSLALPGLYGIGPEAFLKGELLLWDGVPYTARVSEGKAMQVKVNQEAEAPFFVFAEVKQWQALELPDSVKNLPQLEAFLNRHFASSEQPFVFKLSGRAKVARTHLVNLPEGSKVSSPEEAHQGLVHHRLKNAEVDVLGFFSRKHQAVFTHHDSFMHLHLISTNRRFMGHLEEMQWKAGSLKLWYAAQ